MTHDADHHDAHSTPTPQQPDRTTDSQGAFWRRWGPVIVLPLSLLFVASAFALKWRHDQRQAAAQAMQTGRSCCAGHSAPEGAIAVEVPAFSLTERSGRTVGLEDLKGKVWIANFIYTRCPGPCPIMTSRLAALARELPVRDDLMYVSFSVDPEHDTPQVLSAFADRYEADPQRWWFLTGSREEIHSLSTKGFLLALATTTQPGFDGPIVHSTRFALVDRTGTIRGYYDGLDSDDLEQLKQDVLVQLKDDPS